MLAVHHALPRDNVALRQYDAAIGGDVTAAAATAEAEAAGADADAGAVGSSSASRYSVVPALLAALRMH